MRYLNTNEKKNWTAVNKNNKKLLRDFLTHLRSKGRNDKTLKLYKDCLTVFFIWNVNYNDNKDFIRIKQEDFLRFREMGFEEMNWSESREYSHEAAISSLSTYIEDELWNDPHYKGFRSQIKDIKIKGCTPKEMRPEYTEDDIQYMLDTLVEDGYYKEACLIALAVYSGRSMREVIKVKVESLVKYADDLYRVSEKFYILKDKFDPYFKLWMDYRKENGIESAWLLPDFDDCKKSWRVEAVGSALAIIGHLTETSMYWTSFTDFAVKEFVKAGIPHEILWEMSGLTDKDLLTAYVKG